MIKEPENLIQESFIALDMTELFEIDPKYKIHPEALVQEYLLILMKKSQLPRRKRDAIQAIVHQNDKYVKAVNYIIHQIFKPIENDQNLPIAEVLEG